LNPTTIWLELTPVGSYGRHLSVPDA
jgi:hypothetical protein